MSVNDPAPYVQVYSSETYLPFSRRSTSGGGAAYLPRHGYDDHTCNSNGCDEDPLPWLDPVTKGDNPESRWADVDSTGATFYEFAPRPSMERFFDNG